MRSINVAKAASFGALALAVAGCDGKSETSSNVRTGVTVVQDARIAMADVCATKNPKGAEMYRRVAEKLASNQDDGNIDSIKANNITVYTNLKDCSVTATTGDNQVFFNCFDDDGDGKWDRISDSGRVTESKSAHELCDQLISSAGKPDSKQ